MQTTEPEQPFVEPWHAELFAVTHSLAKAGHFEWSNWSAHFSAALKAADLAGAPKDGSTYYDIWLAAFEDYLILNDLADGTALQELKQAWTGAYLATPHGAPVVLGNQS